MSESPSRYQYWLEIVRQQDSAGLGRRPVPDSYLQPGREQLIFHGQRRGRLEPDPTGVDVATEPVFDDEVTGQIQGVRMSAAAAGRRVSLEFGLGLFQSFSQKLMLELVAGEQLQAGDDVLWRVFAEKEGGHEPSLDGPTKVTRRALPLQDGRLRDLLPRATPVGVPAEDDYPVFVTEQALQQAHQFVWQRNRERGVWLVGNLYRQVEPHELFCVIHTVFEAQGTTHERFNIDFTTETFTHAQQQMRRFNKRLGRPYDVLVGFYHTHPFLPSILDGMEACPHCSLRPTCKLTSSFFSQRDQAFHAAMFAGAPYAVEFVLGLTPREEYDLKMFCCDAGQFRQRSYYRLAELPPAVIEKTESVDHDH